MKAIYQFRAEPEMIKVVDQYRGDIPRSALIRRAVCEYMKVHPDANGKGFEAASASTSKAEAMEDLN
jgi:hypothetical protein